MGACWRVTRREKGSSAGDPAHAMKKLSAPLPRDYAKYKKRLCFLNPVRSASATRSDDDRQTVNKDDAMSDDPANAAPSSAEIPRKALPPAAQRALAEAEERRRQAAELVTQRPRELQGPKGPEPTRYGDWERKGIVSDF